MTSSSRSCVRTGLTALAPCLALVAGVASGGPAQQPDSQGVLRSARDAQAEFERIRRNNLPTELGARPDRCDEYIGRFCFWDDDDGKESSSPPAPPEAEPITRARERLVQALDSAAARLPGDGWIAGQHV